MFEREDIFKLKVQVPLQDQQVFVETVISGLFLCEPEGGLIDGFQRFQLIAQALAGVHALQTGKKLFFYLLCCSLALEDFEKNIQLIEEFAFSQLPTLSP